MVGVLAQASNSTASKSFKSALCVIPSRTSAIYQAMQEVRCFNDKSFSRWPPHVNLLYPFVPDEGRNFAVAAERASAAVRGLRPFQASCQCQGVRAMQLEHLSNLDVDAGSTCAHCSDAGPSPEVLRARPELHHVAGPGDKRRRCDQLVFMFGIHAHADPAINTEAFKYYLSCAELVSLQRALVRAFPDCTDLIDDPSRGIEHFTPHMSVGQWRTRAEVTEVMPSLQESFRAMGPVDVASVALISRKVRRSCVESLHASFSCNTC